jgi:DNA-binding IclR family transcriptional regulator
LYRPDIPVNAKMILLCLSSFMGASAEAWPSIPTLAEMAGVSPSTARRALTVLREKGLVDWVERARDDGAQTSNLYRLNLNPPSQDETGGVS